MANLIIGAPVKATPATEALYDADPSLWPSVRAWKTHAQLIAEMRKIGKRLKAYPTKNAKHVQRMRNKRTLLFAKCMLTYKNLQPELALAILVARSAFHLDETRLPGDAPFDKRRSVTFLMEFSMFLGSLGGRDDL